MAREQVTLSLPAELMTKIDYLRGKKTRQAYIASLLAVIVAAASEEQARQDAKGTPVAEPCKHPPARVHKGLCHSCGINITK